MLFASFTFGGCINYAESGLYNNPYSVYVLVHVCMATITGKKLGI